MDCQDNTMELEKEERDHQRQKELQLAELNHKRDKGIRHKLKVPHRAAAAAAAAANSSRVR